MVLLIVKVQYFGKTIYVRTVSVLQIADILTEYMYVREVKFYLNYQNLPEEHKIITKASNLLKIKSILLKDIVNKLCYYNGLNVICCASHITRLGCLV